MAPIDDLRSRVAASRASQDDRDRSRRYAQVDEADAAAAHVELEVELERAEWIAAQISLGADPEDIDADRRIVTSLPLGPVHVVTDEGVVTYHPDSDEAETIRQSPARGVELADGQPVNPAAHLPYEEPPADEKPFLPIPEKTS